jgi:hypothetical protein
MANAQPSRRTLLVTAIGGLSGWLFACKPTKAGLRGLPVCPGQSGARWAGIIRACDCDCTYATYLGGTGKCVSPPTGRARD